MPQQARPPKLSETGLLTPDNCVVTLIEWQRDWAASETYDAVRDIVKNHCGAYGAGVEYACTMVHGAPPTKSPEYVVPVAAAAHP
jgi:hypothetical protein